MTANTRHRILQQLRRGEQCVIDLSNVLGLAPNTIRTHLNNLERDNLVRRCGVRRTPGAGKPAHIFQLTQETQTGYSRAYVPVLKTLVDVISERMDESSFCELMDDVGLRLSPEPIRARATNGERLQVAMAMLEALGATLTTARANGNIVIEGAACPLGEVVSHQPRTCRVVQALLSVALGVHLTADCRYSGTPACRFFSRAEDTRQA